MGCEFLGFGTNWMWGVGILIIRILALVGLFLIIMKIINKNRGTNESNKPLEILKEKYAKGEMDEAEYNYKVNKLKE